MNKTNEEVMYKLINKSQQIKLTIPAKAIQSILIN
jgi:hypothetical protein